MSNETERPTKHKGFKIIDGTKDAPFEVRLREEFAYLDEEALGITTGEFKEELAQRVMDNIPTPPLEDIEKRVRHNILGFIKGKKRR